MTTISVLLDEGSPVGVTAEGHAGFAENGSDIVCSAISTLLFTLAIGIKEVAHLEDAVFQATPEGDDSGNFFKIHWPRSDYEKVANIVETILLGLRRLEYQFGDYLCVTEVHIHDSV